MINWKKLGAFGLIFAITALAIACSKQKDTVAAPDISPEQVAELDKKLNALQIDVNIEHFNKVLGEPVSENTRNITQERVILKRQARPRKVQETYTFKEYIYVNPHYYVQAVTNEKNEVGMYSITIRNSVYKPTLQTVLGQQVQLGKSVYDELDRPPRKIGADFKTSGRAAYYEILLADNEQTLLAIFSNNPFGYTEKLGSFEEGKDDIFVKWFSLWGGDFPLHEEHDAFRKKTAFNTYSVSAPWFSGVDSTAEGSNLGEDSITFGPRADPLAKQDEEK